MIDAAALAAASASAFSCGPNSATSAAVTLALRDASAAAMKVPARCCVVRLGSVASEPRFSLMSFAYWGSADLRDSRDIVGFSRGKEDALPAAVRAAGSA